MCNVDVVTVVVVVAGSVIGTSRDVTQLGILRSAWLACYCVSASVLANTRQLIRTNVAGRRKTLEQNLPTKRPRDANKREAKGQPNLNLCEFI